MKQKNLLFAFAILFALGCSEFGDNSKSNSGTPNVAPDHSNQNGNNSYSPEVGELPEADEETDAQTPARKFSEKAMLLNIGHTVIQRATKTFRLESENLVEETQAYCQALENSDDVEAKEQKVKSQWKEAMLAYHRLNAAPVGPLSENSGDLADQTYAWPYINVCGIDSQVEKLSRTGQATANLPMNVKGLGALEYLLFDSELKTQCNPNNASLKPVHDWVTKPDLEKKKDRCALAHQLARDVEKNARTLERRWDKDQGNYTNTLITGTVYKDTKEAINALSNSMFSIEKLKDDRLGKPLGLHKDCLEASGKCVEQAEHPWSGLALEAIEAQIQGFQSVFWGSSKPTFSNLGFDDYLAHMGRKDVAENMTENLGKILRTLKDIKNEGSLQNQILSMNAADCKATTASDRKVKVCALYHDVRVVTTKMKTEFLMALSLQAPPTYQGDND